LSFILLVGSPFYLIVVCLNLKGRSYLGKLGVVYDQAGKARIVAMANWWLQIALKPLHKSIFSFLRTLETDGTFNQEAPIDRLISRTPRGQSYFCFDLTAATDRIPVDFLVQILSLSKVRGDVWKILLDIPWLYRGCTYKYTVGQAMGAYSSWGMLAVFNHIAIAISARRAGLTYFFSEYAVLGDDVVIANDDVSREYHALLLFLGLDISLSKSLISKDILEFAKKLKGPEMVLTPLGAGVILQSLRHKYAIAVLFLEAVKCGYLSTSASVLEVANSFPKLGNEI